MCSGVFQRPACRLSEPRTVAHAHQESTRVRFCMKGWRPRDCKPSGPATPQVFAPTTHAAGCSECLSGW
eukprot:15018392-Alexandrium_andersonii.AAC.1